MNVKRMTLEISDTQKKQIEEAIDKVRYLGFDIKFEYQMAIRIDKETSIGKGMTLVEVTATDPMAYYAFGVYTAEFMKGK
jgi:hypothetical protein